MLRNKCKFNNKQQNVTTVLFVVKQSYQRIGKIKAEESSGEEGVLLPSFFLQRFLPSFSSISLPLLTVSISSYISRFKTQMISTCDP